jgi:hypothetical protein
MPQGWIAHFQQGSFLINQSTDAKGSLSMKRTASVFFVLVLATIILDGVTARADNAMVLPKGVFNTTLDAKFYLPIDKRFDPDGDEEDLAADLNGTLDSTVFPALAGFEVQNGGPLPAGTANLGDTQVEFELHVQEYDFYFYYGLFPKLTIGAKVPIIKARNDVDTALDTNGATIGSNPLGPGGFAPIGTPGTTPLTEDDIQNLIVEQYGFKKVKDWNSTGFGDIEIGARYQYFSNETWRLAFTGALRLPTGEEDDPDDLADVAFGTGAYAALLYLHNDFLGLKDYGLEFNASLKYEYFFEDHPKVRVPDDVNQPIVPAENKERVDRKIGDLIKVDLEARYDVMEGLSTVLFYRYSKNFKDDIDGDRGLAYDQLEKESDEMEQQYRIGISYSTLPLYAQKKFPIPMSATVYYRDRFDGENVYKSQYIGLILSVYF